MESVARHHYPQIAFRDGVRMLWNPIERKAFKNRPEERVRLRILEHLMHEAGWSRHRIAAELPVDLPFTEGETPRRADLLCYTRDFKPLLLIECKAENVRVNPAAAEQIARYNARIEAPWLMLTNGVEDRWYAWRSGDEKKTAELPTIPGPFAYSGKTSEHDFAYWRDRGFLGGDAVPELRRKLPPLLNQLFNTAFSGEHPIRFLSFNNSPLEFSINHFYRVYSMDKDEHLACSVTATPYGASRLIAIRSRSGQNIGLLDISLDLLLQGEAPNATLYDHRGTHTFDASAYLDIDQSPLFSDLPGILKPIFTI